MGFLGACFWLRYGSLKEDFTMISVNMVGSTLMLVYLLFYIYFTKRKRFIIAQFIAIVSLILTMLVAVHIYQHGSLSVLGFISMSFNILNFGAPLAGVKIVFRKKCCDSLPLPLCTANLLVSAQWTIYGVLVDDIYIIIPNSAGVVLAILQLSLFLIFPQKVGGNALLSCCLASKEHHHHKNGESEKEAEARRERRAHRPWNTNLNSAQHQSGSLFDASFSSSSTNFTDITSIAPTELSEQDSSRMSRAFNASRNSNMTALNDDELDEDEEMQIETTPLNSPSHLQARQQQAFVFDERQEIEYEQQHRNSIVAQNLALNHHNHEPQRPQ